MAKTIEELKAQTRPTLKGNRVRGNSRLSKGQSRKGKGYSEPAASGKLGPSMAGYAMAMGGLYSGLLDSQAQQTASILQYQAQAQQAALQRQYYNQSQQAGFIRARRPAWGKQYGNG